MSNEHLDVRAVCVTTGGCIFIEDNHDLSMFDPEYHSVVFRGGVHNISGMTIGGQIVVTGGAVVHGENVTVDLTKGRRVHAEHWRGVLPRQSFFRRIFCLPNKDERLLVDCPFIARGGSTLSIPGVKVLMDKPLDNTFACAAYEASKINLTNSEYITPDGDDPVFQRGFKIAMSSKVDAL